MYGDLELIRKLTGPDSGTTLESQAPWLRCLRNACGVDGTMLADLLESETFPIHSLPFSVRDPVDYIIVYEALSRSLSVLARISILTAALAKNIHDIRNEISRAKKSRSCIEIDELIAFTFQTHSATILQDLGISSIDWVPARRLLRFIAAFKNCNGDHLVEDNDNPIYTLLAVFTDSNYGFLYKTWPLAVQAIYAYIVQTITVDHPFFLGDFLEAHDASACLSIFLEKSGIDSLEPDGEQYIISQLDRINVLVSFALSSFAGLVRVEELLKQDVHYPGCSATRTYPELVTSNFLPFSSNMLVQLILELPPRFDQGKSWNFALPPCHREGTSGAAR